MSGQFFLKWSLVAHIKPSQFSVGNFGGRVSSSHNASINHIAVLCSCFWGKSSIPLTSVLLWGPASVGILCSVCVVVTVNRIYGCGGPHILWVMWRVPTELCELPWQTPLFWLPTSLLLGRWRVSIPLYSGRAFCPLPGGAAMELHTCWGFSGASFYWRVKSFVHLNLKPL